MKKQEKLDVIQRAIAEKEPCRCFFDYDENYYYYYPNAVNEKLILGQEEDDFLLDGYCIRRISQLRKVEIRDNLCNRINRHIGLTDQIVMPKVDISSWEQIFRDLQAMDRFLIIEDERTGAFAIGLIEKVLRNKLYFKPFDADGVWDEDGVVIPYSRITAVKWGTRYADVWQQYLQGDQDNNH